MIPYPIFMFKIIWPDDTLDVRALEPVDKGFSFRVAQSRRQDLKRLAKYVVSFLNVKTKEYTEYETSGYIEEREEDYIFVPEDERFINDFQNITKDYMKIIYTKLENDDIEAMEIMSGLKLSDEFYSDVYEWKNSLCKPNCNGFDDLCQPIDKNYVELCKLNKFEIAICLDNDNLYNEYLNMRKEEFIEFYWKENCLEKFEISKCKITHIYIGNQFCPYLFPDNDKFVKIINKSISDGLKPVIALGPQNENLINGLHNTLIALTKMNIKERIELVINDIGVAVLVKDLQNKGILNKDQFILTAGILLNKRKKDSRISFLANASDITNSNLDNCWNDKNYTDYMIKNLGISAVSYEACGDDLHLGDLSSILHLPRYQTNSSDCVMYNLWEYGDRGARGDLSKCPHLCNNNYILYPKNTGLMGIGNSIFALSQKEINDLDYLSKLKDKGLKRLVIRL